MKTRLVEQSVEWVGKSLFLVCFSWLVILSQKQGAAVLASLLVGTELLIGTIATIGNWHKNVRATPNVANDHLI